MNIPDSIKHFWMGGGWIVNQFDSCSEYGECVTIRKQGDLSKKFIVAYEEKGEMRYWLNVNEFPAIICNEEEFIRFSKLKAFL